MALSTRPPKGTIDWTPEEFAIRDYIFATWRQVCQSFGYEEYLTPIVEDADIYRAKSGEDVGGKELMTMTDKAGRELAIRPEMTPSVTRMVSERYEAISKPVRYFSIANFLRNEKPQKGRNREFWQLNYDLFGSSALTADVEVLEVAIRIMQEFGANEEDFVVFVNHRQVIEELITDFLQIPAEKISEATRVLDKFAKLDHDEFLQKLEDLGAKVKDADLLIRYLDRDEEAMQQMLPSLEKQEGYKKLQQIMAKLQTLGLENYVRFNPGMVRGFDYYDGMVFEVFDTEVYQDSSQRSLFGGGRYNGLAGIFGMESFPAVGCAPGDETTKLFLQNKGLIAEDLIEQNKADVYVPLLSEEVEAKRLQLIKELRQAGKKVEQGLEQQAVGKALGYADRKGIQQVILLGENEVAKGIYVEKDMVSGEQVERGLG